MPDLIRGGIAINEVLIDPNTSGTNGFDTDGNGAARGGDEFLELENTSNAAIDISGLQLWDAGQDNWFTFPPGSVLPAGGRALVVRNVQNGGTLPAVSASDLVFDADFGTNVFNNGGDNIVVYDPDADTFIQARYNNDALDDPTGAPANDYVGFSATATRIGNGENFGLDVDGSSIQRTPTGFTNEGNPTPGADNVCFASGTLIATPTGFARIEDLRPGDLIMTKDAGAQPLRWIYARDVSHLELMGHPNLRPVVIPGDGPALRVSRQHRLLVDGKIAQRMFGADQILIPAKDLVGNFDVQMDASYAPLQYFHLLLDDHHILNANGFAAESLYLGAEGLNALTPAARSELAALFPGLMAPVRPLVSGHKVRRLVHRSSKNDRQVATAF